MNFLNQFLFGYYPYLCLTVFLAGSLIRFDRDQYTWKSDSSQLLRAGQLRWGSNLFHIGILFLLGGHTMGLLTPHFVYEHFVSAPDKQLGAMISGGLFGLLGFIGVTILLHRPPDGPAHPHQFENQRHRCCWCCCGCSSCSAWSPSRCRRSTWTAA